MDVEEVLERINGWGRYQKVIYFLACLPAIIGAAVTVGFSWTGFVMEHRCLVEVCEDVSSASYNASFLHWSTPPDDDYTWSRCEMYQQRNTTVCEQDSFLTNQTEPCTHWVYDTSVMESTVVSEFNLVCDRSNLQPLETSLFFIGTGIGSILTGIVADRYGRMVALMGSIIGTSLFSGLGALSKNYGTFTAMRFLVAISQYGLFGVAFVWCTEFTSTEVRAFCGIIINIFFAIGEALSGVFPIFIKDWQSLQLICSLPALVFCSYWFLFPESPRWLMSTNQPKKAEEVLRKIAKWNGTSFPEELVKQERNDKSPSEQLVTSESFLDAMKTPVLRRRAYIIFILWFVVTLVYYGIGMVSTEFAGDIYVNFILTMLIEIPSYLFCAFTINPLGRKLVIGGAFALTGLGTICCALVPDDGLEWLTTTLALMGKFGAASAFSTVYLYTAELFPDALRAKGVGLASTCGRLGAVIAPFISELGNDSATLPLCIFGVSGLVASVLTFLLPETSGHDLPNTIAEAVDFGRGQSWLPVPCLVARRRRKQTELAGHDGPQLAGYDGPQRAEKTPDGGPSSDGDVQRA